LLLGAVLSALPVFGQTDVAPAASPGLRQMSLDDLLDLQVTSMSRKQERWWSASGAIEIVTSDDIRRSGAMNLPDTLRLATGVDVAQSSARSWGISIRGFDVLAANKIAVLMDGRSLYTPFFSGTQWDAQDTMIEDIDRIEVVRGPVGALWGAYAVNGFIQIVTKPADDTQGFLGSAGAGTEDPGFVSLRYGGKISPTTFYRVYVKYFQTDWTYLPGGGHAEPATDFFQTGFRIDSALDKDSSLTFQGDGYSNNGLPLDRVQTEIGGGNLLGRWRRNLDGDRDIEIQAYHDHTLRLIPSTWEERRDTSSLSFKYHLPLGRHDLLLGEDTLVSWDKIAHLSFVTLEPPEKTTHNIGAYVQDTIALVPNRWSLTLGVKGEHNSFSGFEVSPSIRAAFTPTTKTTMWTALSRAVRPPVRVDQDLVFDIGGTRVVQATDNFKAEQVLSYEIGFRTQPLDVLSFDLATFLNHYTDLRSTEPLGSAPLPVTFKNGLRANSAGAELSVMYRPLNWWSFDLSYRYLDLEFSNAPDSRDSAKGTTEGNDPRHLFSLRSHTDLRWHLEFDAALRYVSMRPNPASNAYVVGDLRLGWRPNARWDVALIGRNLFDAQHRELITTNSLNEEVGPSGTLKVTWKY
jgi:iron complex outermembrane receptor protein